MSSSGEHTRLVRQLAAAARAHDLFERTELHGVRDEQWSDWYAHYLIEHGWNEGQEPGWTEEALAAALREADVAYREVEREETWPSYYATRLAKS